MYWELHCAVAHACNCALQNFQYHVILLLIAPGSFSEHPMLYTAKYFLKKLSNLPNVKRRKLGTFLSLKTPYKTQLEISFRVVLDYQEFFMDGIPEYSLGHQCLGD
jgi:hypothetical protein